MNEILAQLIAAKETKDSDLLENLLNLKNQKKYNTLHTEILCQLLKEVWHDRHEDIIMTLNDIKDTRSIDSIYEASLYIPEWDDGRSLAKKCIWALRSINTFESIEKIKILANSNDLIIRETAKLNLQ